MIIDKKTKQEIQEKETFKSLNSEAIKTLFKLGEKDRIQISQSTDYFEVKIKNRELTPIEKTKLINYVNGV